MRRQKNSPPVWVHIEASPSTLFFFPDILLVTVFFFDTLDTLFPLEQNCIGASE